MILEHSMPIVAKCWINAKTQWFPIFLCNIVRPKKIKDFQQGIGDIFWLEYEVFNFIGDKIFAP
ncbi:hypothetical protein DEU39_0682 [Chryseobacterium sp. AG363]|nr:hypothetical protein DEU39_0682 [Chryseobacterium sp. AG363]